MPNVFESDWSSKTLAKGDLLMVPPASKHRRALWVRAQMPAWDSPKTMSFEATSQPWWLFQKGQVLTVLARPTRQYDNIWVPVHSEEVNAAVGFWASMPMLVHGINYQRIQNLRHQSKNQGQPVYRICAQAWY